MNSSADQARSKSLRMNNAATRRTQHRALQDDGVTETEQECLMPDVSADRHERFPVRAARVAEAVLT